MARSFTYSFFHSFVRSGRLLLALVVSCSIAPCFSATVLVDAGKVFLDASKSGFAREIGFARIFLYTIMLNNPGNLNRKAFQALECDSTALWNFLLFTGYLTFTRVWNEQDLPYVELAIPNAEINSLYRTVMTTWFTQIFEIAKYQRMLQNLVQGNMLEFRERFTDFVGKTLSSFDVGGTEPEKFYHALVLGMLVSLENTHEIKSNRESGFGRYDVMLIPKDSNLPGIIIEFKKVSTLRKETLETAAQAALAQIAEKNYAAELHTRGITHSIPLAIVFQGRDVLVREGPC
jgi:hypothetical protein